ncbi:MAG: protein N-lysine methyltransferase family protein [Planctomycetes bacterium]|nr:protein N-lysine methyltransferase family protein [Planctomycetota bacterium]
MPWLLPPDPRFLPDDAADPAGADLTWAYDWPAGRGLARDLAALADCRGRRVADLGCGRGGLGAAALQAGAAAVAFCDGSARALAYVAEAVRLNQAGDRARCHIHRWGEPLPDGPWDLILGGDLLYRPAVVPALLASIAASLAAEGCALLSDMRHQADDEIEASAGQQGLTTRWQQADGYALYRLNRLA